MSSSGTHGSPWLIAAAMLTLVGTGRAARAGTLRFSVSDLHFSRPVLQTGVPTFLSYTLSGSATGVAGALHHVAIDFLRDDMPVKTLTLLPGEPGTLPGANTVRLDIEDTPGPGRYRIRVTAVGVDFTATDYVEVSRAQDPDLQFANPRGVDANRIPGSPQFGRVYVSEGGGGQTANRTTEDGVYALNPDLTPAFPGARATNADLGALGPWAASPNSPFRVCLAPDGRVAITDCSDPHAGLFIADPDLTTVKALFAYPAPAGGARASSGRVTNSSGVAIYGSTSSAAIVRNGDQDIVYTTDEDLAPGNSLFQRSIPAGATDTAVPPTLVAGIPGANWVQDVARDSSGTFYVVSLTSDDAARYDVNGATLARLPANGTGYYGLCLDEERSRVLLATNDGRIFQADPAFSTSAAIVTNLGAEVRDVAVDADGWIYAPDVTDHRLHVFVPSGDYGAGEASAVSPEPLDVQMIVPGDIAPLGPSGLFTGPNGGRYGDGRLDLSDTLTLLRLVFGLDAAP